MICAIIQARMGSTRLPGKIMMDINGKSVLSNVIERVKKSKLIDKIIVATTDEIEDKITVEYCIDNSIGYFSGSKEDVLDRYYKAATQNNIGKNDHIVRITADCPLIDSSVVDNVISLYTESNVDYASNINPPSFPDGMDIEVFSFDALQCAWNDAKLQSEREHVTPYIRNNKHKFSQVNLKNSEDYSSLRLTVDEAEDLLLVRTIYKMLDEKNLEVNLQNIIELFKNKPDLAEINSNYARNEGYAKSIKNDKVEG